LAEAANQGSTGLWQVKQRFCGTLGESTVEEYSKAFKVFKDANLPTHVDILSKQIYKFMRLYSE
jgi:hypothetical protein